MSEKIEDGGPAYPQSEFSAYTDDRQGMSLRDWFAGQALAGLMAMPDGPNGNFHNNCQDIGGYAYVIADKLIAARKAGA